MTEQTPREQALASTRDALAALHEIPVAGVDQQKAETILAVVEDVQALEQQLTNEVEQQRGDDDE